MLDHSDPYNAGGREVLSWTLIRMNYNLENELQDSEFCLCIFNFFFFFFTEVEALVISKKLQ